MSDVENSIPPFASGKSFPWYLCLMYVYAFGEKHFCMFNANKVFVLYLYCIILYLLSITPLQNIANTLYDTIGEIKGMLLFCFRFELILNL